MCRMMFKALMVLVAGRAAGQCGPEGRLAHEAYWQQLNAEFADSATSPLTDEARRAFKGLDVFPFDSTYCVRASFTREEDAAPFLMATTRTRTPTYKVHGNLRFMLNGKEHTLQVYESVPPHPGHEDHLFVPFTDLTNGEETYGVGRYLDLVAPLGQEVDLDFNRAYNPYCAYNDKYSCPIPPKANHLITRVLAGVRGGDRH